MQHLEDKLSCERDEKIKIQNKKMVVLGKKDRKIEELETALHVDEVLSFSKRTENNGDLCRCSRELTHVIHSKRDLLTQYNLLL